MKSNKHDLIQDINLEKQKLDELLSIIPEEKRNLFGSYENWVIKDFLAHLTSWEMLFLNWYRDIQSDEKIQAPAPGYQWDNYAPLNEEIFVNNKDREYQDVYLAYQSQFYETMAFAESIDEDGWFGNHSAPWYGSDTPFAEPLWVVTGEHYLWAIKEIKIWMKKNI